MKKLSWASLFSMICALAIVSSVLALVSNGNFETGDFTGWSKSTFLNKGFNSARAAGGADLSAIVGGPSASPLSLSDSHTNDVVKYPAYGHYSVRVNSDQSYRGAGHSQNGNIVSQTVSAVLDPSDNLWHLRFAYAAVMVDPLDHTVDEKPYFRVRLINSSKGDDVLYDFSSYVGEPGKNWADGPLFNSTDSWKYIDWTYIDIASSVAHPVDAGDDILIEVIAAGCQPGGHPGYVYVDEITDSTIAGPSITASGPATGTVGGPITYTYNFKNGTGSAINPTIVVTPPTNVTFTTLGDEVHCSGLSPVTCNFSMDPSATGSFTVSGTISAGAGGTTIAHGDYTIAATGFPTIGGPTVYTTVPGNAAPVATADSYSTHMGTALSATTVLSNDTDAESDPLTAVQDSSPSHASTFTFNSDGTFSYTPTAGYVGDDSFTYHANDTHSDSSTVTVTIHVTNTAPVAVADSYSTHMGTALSATTVKANDSDADSDPISPAKDTNPSHSSAFTFNADGTFSYTPAAGYVGDDSFTYHVNDGQADSSSVTVTIHVTNTAPVAQNNTYNTKMNTALNGTTVLGNDTDADSDALTAALNTSPSHASAFTLNTNGTFSYTPTTGYTGTDSFTYHATDGGSDSNIATVTINITNDVPSVTGGTTQSMTLDEDTTTWTVLDLNATDPDNDPITWAAGAVKPQYGSMQLNTSTGAVSYLPKPNYYGPDQLTVTVTDGKSTPIVVTVNITVNPIDDPLMEQNSNFFIFNGWNRQLDNTITSGMYITSVYGKLVFPVPSGATVLTLNLYRGPDQGIFEMQDSTGAQINGKQYSLYNATPDWITLNIPVPANPSGGRILLAALGTKSVSSTASWIRLDSFKFNNAAMEEADVNLTNWEQVSEVKATGGLYRKTTKSFSKLSLTYVGQRPVLYTYAGPDAGIINIYVDGVLVKTVDLYNATPIWKLQVLVGNLPYGKHTIDFVSTGTKNALSTAINFILDAIDKE